MFSTIDMMTWCSTIVGLIKQCDQVLATLSSQHGLLIYGVVFLILFCETGLIIAPFLPGDSLLFVVGALAAQGYFNVVWMGMVMLIAAILGDAVNYQIGYWSSVRWLHITWLSRWISQEALQNAQGFYAQYGGKSLVLARFVPILRTFAPFIAGLSQMPYGRFSYYNIVGALLWICCFTVAGYFLGHFPVVKSNLHYLLLVTIALSLIVPTIQWWRRKGSKGI